jgi:hypothetical protein
VGRSGRRRDSTFDQRLTDTRPTDEPCEVVRLRPGSPEAPYRGFVLWAILGSNQ